MTQTAWPRSSRAGRSSGGGCAAGGFQSISEISLAGERVPEIIMPRAAMHSASMRRKLTWADAYGSSGTKVRTSGFSFGAMAGVGPVSDP